MVNSKKKKKGRRKKKAAAAADQSAASRFVLDWFLAHSPPPPPPADEFLPPPAGKPPAPPNYLLFDLHSHTKHSDGSLSPSALVERAHRNGVNVLALTDHDTMAGVPEAVQAANKFGIRIIPGVEISALHSPVSGKMEVIHVLAYYGSCGPARYEELDVLLSTIRDGRYDRAKEMLSKLDKLKMPLKLEHVIRIAGDGVAPGRVHVAKAMVEAGHVENMKQAFSKYLYDDGPAYAMGCEPPADEVVRLICRTGGVAALAHPWTLKDPFSVLRSLKAAGLHALEVYRSDGKMDAFSDLASSYDLVRIGGSDFHGKGDDNESEVGSVRLPVQSIYGFLTFARPIWCGAAKDILSGFAEEPTDRRRDMLLQFAKPGTRSGCLAAGTAGDVLELCLSSWLTREEREGAEVEAMKLKLS